MYYPIDAHAACQRMSPARVGDREGSLRRRYDYVHSKHAHIWGVVTIVELLIDALLPTYYTVVYLLFFILSSFCTFFFWLET